MTNKNLGDSRVISLKSLQWVQLESGAPERTAVVAH